MDLRPLACALGLAACGSGQPTSDFRLVEIDRKVAKVIDFGAVEIHRDGARTVTMIGVANAPLPSAPRKSARFVHFKYRFDCGRRLYRGEGVFAYDREFRLVHSLDRVSAWRRVDGAPRLVADFKLFCATDPAATSRAERLPVKNWTEAADLVLQRLSSQRSI